MNDYYGRHMPERRTNPILFVLVPLMVIGAPIILAILLKHASSSLTLARPTPHPVGATVTDDGFTFRVTSMKTRKRIKSNSGTDTAKGRFVLVSLDVTNTGDKPRDVYAIDQFLRAGDESYGADVTATVDSDKDPQGDIPRTVNPGKTESIVIVYDVLAGATPQALTLHGVQGSDGVVVALPAT